LQYEGDEGRGSTGRGQLQEGSVSSPTTQQLRTAGRRRREAEEKLEHHIETARHKHDLHGGAAGPMDGRTLIPRPRIHCVATGLSGARHGLRPCRRHPCGLKTKYAAPGGPKHRRGPLRLRRTANELWPFPWSQHRRHRNPSPWTGGPGPPYGCFRSIGDGLPGAFEGMGIFPLEAQTHPPLTEIFAYPGGRRRRSVLI
jgi:hypothetical protein